MRGGKTTTGPGSRKPLIWRITLFAIAKILITGPAQPVCFKPDPKVCAEYFKSDAVFTGTVLSERAVPDQGDVYDGWIYQLQVIKAYRGPARNSIQVFTENSSGRMRLEVGKLYLLFAAQDRGRLTITNCGNSAEIDKAGETIRGLEQLMTTLKTASRGEVSGLITEGYVGLDGRGVAGILVTANGGGKAYKGVSGKDGWFHISVPPGKYAVSAKSEKWNVIPYDLSYDDPTRVVVHRGGCTAIQFLVQ